jgi:hypothetical protein
MGNFHCRVLICLGACLQRTQQCERTLLPSGMEATTKIETHFLAMQENVIARADYRVDAVLAINCSRQKIQIVLAVVAIAGREECTIEIVAVVIDGATAAVASGELNAGRFELTDVRFGEGILMATNDDARIVQPQHQNVVIAEIVVLVDPVLEGEVRENVIRLRNENRFSNRLICI